MYSLAQLLVIVLTDSITLLFATQSPKIIIEGTSHHSAQTGCYWATVKLSRMVNSYKFNPSFTGHGDAGFSCQMACTFMADTRIFWTKLYTADKSSYDSRTDPTAVDPCFVPGSFCLGKRTAQKIKDAPGSPLLGDTPELIATRFICRCEMTLSIRKIYRQPQAPSKGFFGKTTFQCDLPSIRNRLAHSEWQAEPVPFDDANIIDPDVSCEYRAGDSCCDVFARPVDGTLSSVEARQLDEFSALEEIELHSRMY